MQAGLATAAPRLQPPAMLPVASGTRGSTQDLFQVGLAPPGGWSHVCQGFGWRVHDDPGVLLRLRATSRQFALGATKTWVSLNLGVGWGLLYF